jgi:hypothetical protein
MKRSIIPISATRDAPVASIKKMAPQVDFSIKNCETVLNIGFFFDGTNNNKAHDAQSHADSNIARLYESYPDRFSSGYSRLYIPGVGTCFPEIGEYGTSKAGAGCAFGCEGRVIFALLNVYNVLHQYSLNGDLFNSKSILALCRNNANVAYDYDAEILEKLGIQHGLLQPEVGISDDRQKFLRQQSQVLKDKLKKAKPTTVECFIDVFGFSRGAAEARVFCHWLDELLVGGRLAGVPLHFRFVGIIDTVASAGFWAGTKAFLINATGGHGDWANADSLRLPTSVQNCVHMVAMHELRRNFPLDEIGTDGQLQPGWVQYAYPGAHSDVGGGYKPGELGISAGDDSMKLSQIPLNHMLECAIVAGAPMKKPTIKPGDHDTFAIHPNLAKAYDDFISEATLAPRPIYEWLQTYLNWRWQIRDHFNTTTQVKLASKEEREILIDFNYSLINDAAAMTRTASTGFIRRMAAFIDDTYYMGARRDAFVTSALEPEAREVFALAQRAAPTPAAFAVLFDGYVHDSLAGFNAPSLELTGYWRYRRVFLGSDKDVLAANQDLDAARNTA